MFREIKSNLATFNVSETASEIYIACLKKENGLSLEQLKDQLQLDNEALSSNIQQLVQNNFLSTATIDETDYYKAENPSHIFSEYEKSLGILKSFLPALAELSNHTDGTKVRYLRGEKGIEIVHEDIINTLSGLSEEERYFYQLVSEKNIFKAFPEYKSKFMDRRMEEEIVMYWMAPKTEEHWYYTNRPDEHLRFSKLFDTGLLPFDIELNIYDNKAAFIILDEGDLGGIIIENESVANSMRALCRFVWKAL